MQIGWGRSRVSLGRTLLARDSPMCCSDLVTYEHCGARNEELRTHGPFLVGPPGARTFRIYLLLRLAMK